MDETTQRDNGLFSDCNKWSDLNNLTKFLYFYKNNS